MVPDPPHFDGKTFFNPGEPSERGLLDLLKWKWTGHPQKWPKRIDVQPQPVPAAPTHGVSATWVGHATFVLRSASATLITDPIFSQRAGPRPWLGVRRAMAPGVAFETLPKIDVILLSHDHFDHCDLPTLRRLAERDHPQVIAPLRHRSLLLRAGLESVAELDWWESRVVLTGLAVTFVPARHWTRRSPFSTNARLWGGFMIRTGGRLIYFAGDSGYEATRFVEIRRRCGPPDLALIPIGAYEPRWFMKTSHMDPAEAVQVHHDLEARRSIGMHWGTFNLTDEGREEPLRALEAARGPTVDFRVLAPGESTFI